MVEFHVVDLRHVDWELFGWDDLFDVQEVNLRDVDRALQGRDDLSDEEEVNLRDVDRLFNGRDDDLDLDVVDLRQVDWAFGGLWIWESDLFDFNRVLVDGLRDDMNDFNDLFLDDWLFDNDWPGFSDNKRLVFDNQSRVFNDY